MRVSQYDNVSENITVYINCTIKSWLLLTSVKMTVTYLKHF